MDKNSFRIILDFSDIHETDHDHVWILVYPFKIRTISEFKEDIIQKFIVLQEFNFKLLLINGLCTGELLDSEKIEILQTNDIVKIVKLKNVFPNQSFERSHKGIDKTSKNPQVEVNLDCNTSTPVKKSKKRERFDLVDLTKCNQSLKHKKEMQQDQFYDDSKLENQDIEVSIIDQNSTEMNNVKEVKKRKHSKSKKQIEINKKSCLSSSNVDKCEKIALVQKEKSDSKKKIPFNDEISFIEVDKSNGIEYQANSNVENSLDNSAINKLDIDKMNENIEISPKNSKRKRKRKRKRKTTLNPENSSMDISCSIDVEPTHLSSEINRAIPSHKTLSSGKHIIYNYPTSPPKTNDTTFFTPDQVENNDELKYNSKNSFTVSALDDCIAKFMEEENSLKSIMGKDNKTSKITTPLSKSKSEVQFRSITPLQNCSSANNKNGEMKITKEKAEETITEKMEETITERTKSYTDYPALKCFPSIGTHLAYRVLELNDSYCPEVTDYKEGVVKNVDPVTEELEIELLHEEIKTTRIGKFENIRLEDEVPSPQIIKRVSIKWTDLIQPRLIV